MWTTATTIVTFLLLLVHGGGRATGVARAEGVARALGLAAVADLSGPWGLEFQQELSSTAVYQADCVWEQEGSRLAGSCTSGFESIVTVRGTVQDSDVSFRFSSGVESGTLMTFSGRLNDGENGIEGTWRFTDPRGNTGGGTFKATKR